MQCPNCNAPEEGRVRLCQTCGTSYASEDLLELRQLEFLLVETEAWPEADERNKPYREQLAVLKARILPKPAPSEPVAPPSIPETQPLQATPQPIIASLPQSAVESAPPRPAPEPKSFDQWLLSERNIKIALYSGGLLLVLAGLIFVSVNWARLSGPIKFAITLMVTGSMYLGGYVLFQRPTLKLGGVALLGVASGFVPLNFVVLQIYIFSARGLSGNMMWLIGSVPTLLLYLLTAYWTRADLFTYLGLGAAVSALTAALVLLDASLSVFTLAYAVLIIGFLLGARALQPTRLASFTYKPLLILSQLGMPAVFIFSIGQWISVTGCTVCNDGSPWLALAAMFLGVLFYAITDITFQWRIARWAASFMFAITVVFLLTELRFSSTATGVSLMILALIYLMAGYRLKQWSDKGSATWPLYTTGYALAAFVTVQALVAFSGSPNNLAMALVGDAILLAISARIHHQYAWVYGATWVFMAPVFIYARLYVPGLSNQGLVLSVLMLNYVAVGYALGRRTLKLGGPFLTAAAFLSVVVVGLTWGNATVASIMLVVIAALYLLVALWLRKPWFLLPALVAVNVLAITILRMFSTADASGAQALTITYAGLGVMLVLGGVRIKQAGQNPWSWPLYLVATFDIVGAYLVSLFLGGSIAIALSIIFALLAFGLAWVERISFVQIKLPPLLTYLGVAFIFIGHFYAIALSEQAGAVWSVYTAGLCALIVAAGLLLRHESMRVVYGTPLHWAGIGLMSVPMAGALYIFEEWVVAVTFAIAGITYAVAGIVRRVLLLTYLAGGMFIVVIWSVLRLFEVEELQAYVIPLAMGLLALDWNERRLGRQRAKRWPTLLGLFILMGSAFYQSFDSVIYAVLLLIESLMALAWGIRIHSRGYVQLGVLSLLANAIAQIGPATLELPRWIQIGVIGSILLGGGLSALFWREQLLAVHKQLTDKWSQWES